MGRTSSFSDALSHLGNSAAIRRPYDLRTLAKLAPASCPSRWTEAAELLLALTGGRGLPRLGDYDFGALADFDCSLRRHRWDPPDIVIAGHASGRRVVLTRKEGAVYLGKYEKLLGETLLVFLERLAAELLPAPAVHGFSIHTRSREDARKLARKVRAAENDAASVSHDGCWSDDRWFITRDRAAARRFEDLSELLAAAQAVGVELGLHDGRGEALLVDAFQPVPEGAQYRVMEGLGAISIRIAEGRRIEQALHYGEIGTEWAEWEDGELLIQRKRPVTEIFAPIPELEQYLFARRIQRIERFGRTEREMQAIFGPDLWPVLTSLERDYGGLVAEDDLTYWDLAHVMPLVAPGYIGETTPKNQRITSIQGQPVHQVGEIKSLLWLCVDEGGHFYVTGHHDYDLEAGGDDPQSTLLRFALDWKHERWRTDASIGAFLDRADAERLLAALRGVAEQKLDTFGHTYHAGPGFELRHRKAVLGSRPYWHLVADSAKRFCNLLRPIASEQRPVRAGTDNQSYPTEEELAQCARAGVALQDTWNL